MKLKMLYSSENMRCRLILMRHRVCMVFAVVLLAAGMPASDFVCSASAQSKTSNNTKKKKA